VHFRSEIGAADAIFLLLLLRSHHPGLREMKEGGKCEFFINFIDRELGGECGVGDL
jgi:hypothetical protein